MAGRRQTQEQRYGQRLVDGVGEHEHEHVNVTTRSGGTRSVLPYQLPTTSIRRQEEGDWYRCRAEAATETYDSESTADVLGRCGQSGRRLGRISCGLE